MVWGLGVGGKGLGSKVYDSEKGFRVQGSRFKALGLRFRV